MSGPRGAVRDVRQGRRPVDLLFYDDALAVVGRGSVEPMWQPVATPVAAAVGLVFGRRLRERAAAREESVETLPRGARVIRYADVSAVRVEPRAYGAALLDIDGTEFAIPEATTYRAPWEQVLRPLFGDRLTVV